MVSANSGSLPEALKQPGTPEACAAGHEFKITIMFKISLSDIIAKREAAVKAEGEPVSQHALPERAEVLIVPDINEILVPQIAGYPRLDPLF